MPPLDVVLLELADPFAGAELSVLRFVGEARRVPAVPCISPAINTSDGVDSCGCGVGLPTRLHATRDELQD